MKSITLSFSAILFLLSSVGAYAATSITSTVVSGHWTTAGSPYKVYNAITISVGTTLTIDAGVDVRFMGNYHFTVQGSLYAVGTPTAPINFHADDTTGWSNASVTNGGWNGISFENPTYYATPGDSASFKYCNVYDLKNAYNIVGRGRSLVISNCNYFHDYGDSSSGLLAGQCDSMHSFEISGCHFFNNQGSVLTSTNYFGGSTYIHDNEIYQNNGNSLGIIYCYRTRMLFENNIIHDNMLYTSTSGSILKTEEGVVTLKGNKIYNNRAYNLAAILCSSGFADISGNLICNNYDITGFCGMSDGGAGITIWANGADALHAYFNVRNNIIANNYTPFEGGAIKVVWADVCIANNQIINNKCGTGSAAIHLNCDTNSALIKNNIFCNNVSGTVVTNVFVDLAKYLTYENNWSQSTFHSDVVSLISGAYILLGDTTTNMSGTSAGLVLPTLAADYTESALPPHDFGLTSSSSCIDKGDIAGITPDTVDYANHARIYGSHIDIGAFEYGPPNSLGITNMQETGKLLSVYPNPAGNIIFITTAEANGTIRLQDVSGKTIKEMPVTAKLTCIDIHNITQGIYFATWLYSHGNKAIQKIIVE